MSLSGEARTRLAAHIMEGPENALRLHGEAPALVYEALREPNILAHLSEDPVLFAALVLGFRATGYQAAFLRTRSKRVLLRWPRQSGKTRALAVYAVWFSVFHPASTTLIVAPSRRQSMIVSDLVHGYLSAMPKRVRASLVGRAQRTTIRLRNRSAIVSLPNSENLLRGYTAHLIIADEAAFFRNDESIFLHVLTPMLATTDGRMVVSSTPWGKGTMFYRYSMDPAWERHHVTWQEAAAEGVYDPSFRAQIEWTREARPLTYRMEYMAEFAEETDTWLTRDLLAGAVHPDLELAPFDRPAEGGFYAGVDLAERVDRSAVAVVRRTRQGLDLVHMHVPKTGTSLASVIGYVKALRGRLNRIHAVYVDNTKHGDYIIEDFHSAGIPEARGVTFTQASKQEMAQLLRQRLQEHSLRLPYDRDLLDELNVEQYTLTRAGCILLDHPEGTHDDRFWALALAVYAAEESHPPSKPVARTV
jgi:phage FluMu gp28-like protein